MKFKEHKKALIIAAAAVLVLGTAAVSAAYWTDKISIDTSVETMNIGIRYNPAALSPENGTLMVPGDTQELAFGVENTGSVSVDIKPVITIEASKDMRSGKSEFRIVNSDGVEPAVLTKKYMDANGKEVDPKEEAFRKISYTLTQEDTLAGSSHKDASLGETNTEASYAYYLKLMETTGNEFVDTEAKVDVSTYAIQHRNRSGSSQESWIEIVVPRKGT